MTIEITKRENLKKIIWNLIWLWLPVLTIISSLIFLKLSIKLLHLFFLGENSFAEILTLVALIPAIYLGIRAFIAATKRKDLKHGLIIKLGLIFLTLGCVYYAGEEASWGQHIFKWQTPENMRGGNAHEETNLHNTTDPVAYEIFNKLPRNTLITLIFVGSIVIPAYFKFAKRQDKLNKLSDDNSGLWLFLPHRDCLLSAIAVIIFFLMTHILNFYSLDYKIYIKPYRELVEAFIGVFLFIYLFHIKIKLNSSSSSIQER